MLACNLKKFAKCNHSICDYMQLYVVCNKLWLFLQLFSNFDQFWHSYNYVAITLISPFIHVDNFEKKKMFMNKHVCFINHNSHYN
jgi:hypothetical protein